MYYISISAENRPGYLSFSPNPILSSNANNNPYFEKTGRGRKRGVREALS